MPLRPGRHTSNRRSTRPTTKSTTRAKAVSTRIPANTVFAGMIVLTVFALVLDFAVGQVEKRLLVWRPAQSETEQL